MAAIFYPPPQPTQARTLLVQPGPAPPPVNDPPFTSRAMFWRVVLAAWLLPPMPQAPRAIMATLDTLPGTLDDFVDTVEFAPAIGAGGGFDFSDTVTILQALFPDFEDTVVALSSFPDFADTVRVIPDVDTPFSETIQRTVGKVEVA